MVTSIILKFLTLKCDISRTIWRIEVSDGSLFCIFHSLSFERNLFFDRTCPLMSLNQTNKTNLAWNGHKLEKLYLNRTKIWKKCYLHWTKTWTDGTLMLPTLDRNLNRWDLKSVKWDHDIHLTKTFQMLIVRKLRFLPVALHDRKGPWPTVCCLGHSDVNSHFKNFNTSNTSLTFCKPQKLRHTLSILSSKHDSMCHRKTCMGQKS